MEFEINGSRKDVKLIDKLSQTLEDPSDLRIHDFVRDKIILQKPNPKRSLRIVEVSADKNCLRWEKGLSLLDTGK